MSLEPLDKMEQPKGRAPLFAFIIFALFIVLAVVLLMMLYERETPQVAMTGDISRFGLSKDVGFVAKDAKRGIRSIEIVMVQDNKKAPVFAKQFPQHGFLAQVGPREVAETFTVESRNLGFRDGVAELLVTVHDFSWWSWMHGNTVTEKYAVVLDTKPPVVSVKDSPHYIKSGSAGVVIYRISEPVSRHGVFINDDFHPGFPLPHKGDGFYGATIGLAHDLGRIEKSYVLAVDEAGNEGKAAFGMILRKKRVVSDRINISDGFLGEKLPEFGLYYPELTGSPVEQYLVVNNKIRRQNYQKVLEICSNSVPERLWDGRFNRLPRSSRRANFADHRSYYYEGRKIDQQVHLGVDLASVRHAKVEAGNRGMVIFADYLGIYGNTVILDHGQGIFSLYSHMSQIDVAVNDLVERGSTLGLTGKTGMAGGDHLHFSILVNGVFVDPVEWWDEQWVKLNFLNYL